MTKLEKLYSIIERSTFGRFACKELSRCGSETAQRCAPTGRRIGGGHHQRRNSSCSHRQAIDTFIDALRKIGLERIPAVRIQHGNGYNLVSKDKRPTMPGRIWQHECDGWYIYSNISNGTKAEVLKRISDHYHLGLKIEEGKPEK